MLNGLVVKCVVVAYVWWDLVAVVVTGILVVKKTLQPLPSGRYLVLLLECSVKRTSQVTLLPPVLLCLAVLCAQYSREQPVDTEDFLASRHRPHNDASHCAPYCRIIRRGGTVIFPTYGEEVLRNVSAVSASGCTVRYMVMMRGPLAI